MEKEAPRTPGSTGCRFVIVEGKTLFALFFSNVPVLSSKRHLEYSSSTTYIFYPTVRVCVGVLYCIRQYILLLLVGSRDEQGTVERQSRAVARLVVLGSCLVRASKARLFHSLWLSPPDEQHGGRGGEDWKPADKGAIPWLQGSR